MVTIREEAGAVKPGARFGKWEVLGVAFRTFGSGRATWSVVCKCECGRVAVRETRSIPKGSSKCKSCQVGDKNRTHGHSDSEPLYFVWSGMKRRCSNKNSKDWEEYGGRGIRVCEEWKSSYLAFRTWAIQNGYLPGLQIDREKNHLGYSPGNCRWVTAKANAANRRSRRWKKKPVICE